ncbi:MAG: hypothetical protein WC758_01370 [Candidatus Woesearchaeota archaeon]|jgi:tRNA threonylcarbamoyladenosine modification (KEOPS) complex  Pcc1 subunit
MLKAIISLEDKNGEIERLFSFEEKILSNGRAEYVLSKKDKLLELVVTAKDSVALRAVLTSITRVLTIDEKTKKVLEDE